MISLCSSYYSNETDIKHETTYVHQSNRQQMLAWKSHVPPTPGLDSWWSQQHWTYCGQHILFSDWPVGHLCYRWSGDTGDTGGLVIVLIGHQNILIDQHALCPLKECIVLSLIILINGSLFNR